MTRSPTPLIRAPIFVWLVSLAFLVELFGMAALVTVLAIGNGH
jgi:hypothetical protein